MSVLEPIADDVVILFHMAKSQILHVYTMIGLSAIACYAPTADRCHRGTASLQSLNVLRHHSHHSLVCLWVVMYATRLRGIALCGLINKTHQEDETSAPSSTLFPLRALSVALCVFVPHFVLVHRAHSMSETMAFIKE